jgi:glycosyltransferase involved in cell wall biosynthesis
MKLLYLCHDAIPSSATRTEQIVQSMCALSRHGFETTMVMPATLLRDPTQSRTEEIRRFYGLAEDCTFPEGLIELKPWIELKTPLGRVLADLQAVRTARGASWDVVYTRDTWALAFAVLSGLPVIFESYRSNFNELRRFWPFRRLVYRRPNLLGVVTHSRYALRSFLDMGVEEQRLHLGYNGYSSRSLLPVRSRQEARDELGIPHEALLAVYAGYVDERKGTRFLLSMAGLAPEVSFLIVGAVPGSRGERELQGEMQKLGLGNVRLLPHGPPPAIPAYLYAADCLLVPPTASPLRQYGGTVLPMKLFVYMATGRPILAPDLPDVREVLSDGHNAVLVKPDDPREAAAALRSILADPARGALLAKRALEDAQDYTWEARAERLARFLRERYAAWQRRA